MPLDAPGLYGPLLALINQPFPLNAIASLNCALEDGASAEIAGVGNEGLVGIALFMGVNQTPAAVVQRAGRARLEKPPGRSPLAQVGPSSQLHGQFVMHRAQAPNAPSRSPGTAPLGSVPYPCPKQCAAVERLFADGCLGRPC